ncbi:hypothetical protein QE152_g26350 [Popillia japonica]|uniref:Zinc finger PHD-type domain-containing protein n=1 Tax=Popillia japonica TaxID=7064 RepID=A0AAW1JYK8_POPJA
MYVCSCCNSETDKLKLITCFSCKLTYNHTCVGISGADLRILSSKSNTGISWACGKCRDGSGDTLSELKMMVANLIQEVGELKKQLEVSKPTPIPPQNFEELIQEVEDY